MKIYIRTFTGRRVDLVEPQPEQIRLRDVAHALAQINRFIGHTPEPYSVAEHAIIGSYAIRGEYAREFLMHDAAEAFLGDVSRPLKGLLEPIYAPLEAGMQRAIGEKFDLLLSERCWGEVKRVDDLMCRCELDVFMGARMKVREMEALGPDALRVFALLRKRTGEDMERAFLLRWAELERRRG